MHMLQLECPKCCQGVAADGSVAVLKGPQLRFPGINAVHYILGIAQAGDGVPKRGIVYPRLHHILCCAGAVRRYQYFVLPTPCRHL